MKKKYQYSTKKVSYLRTPPQISLAPFSLAKSIMLIIYLIENMLLQSLTKKNKSSCKPHICYCMLPVGQGRGKRFSDFDS